MKKFLILIDGPMGSGKTTTSKLVNEWLPDTARIALPDVKRLVPNFRENDKTLAIVRDVMWVMIEKYLEHGISVIVEQITSTDGILPLIQVAVAHGAEFHAFRLTAQKEVRLQRVYERTKEMMKVSELPEAKIAEMNGYFEPNDQFYIENPIPEAIVIDSEKLSSEECADLIIAKLA